MVTFIYLIPNAPDSQCPQYIALRPGVLLVSVFLMGCQGIINAF